MIREFNDLLLKQAARLNYTVKSQAPNSELDLFNSPTLVVWSGASDHTIWGDKRVNWAFRALHDHLHLKTGLGFSPAEEIELGRLQANKYSGLLADLIYCEVSGQAEYYLKKSLFVADQVLFTKNKLKLFVNTPISCM